MTAQVDAALDRVDKDATRLGVSLSLLAAALLKGEGQPHPHEMTPAQNGRLIDIMGPIARLAGLILQADVALTLAREDAEAEDTEDPARPN